MTLDRQAVELSLRAVLGRVPDVEFRLVGTASSVLRGIALPAHDIDVLFRERVGVDAWFDALSGETEVDAAPEWSPADSQYFARLDDHGVMIELSTVEIEVPGDTNECFGRGPWEHFDVLPAAAGSGVPAVATELRLITEIARQRPDRYRPIMRYLSQRRCDVVLIRRGLATMGVAQDVIDRVIDRVTADNL